MQRNYGIDFFRMFAMLMIAVLHITGYGGIINYSDKLSAHYEVGCFLQIATFCAVNCYALISGFVGVNSKYRYTNIVVLWLKVVFYTMLISFCFGIFIPGSVGFTGVKNAIMPVITQQYWYFTAYFCLFFFIPLLNKAINNMTQKQLRAVIIAVMILISVIQTIFTDIFATASGYSAAWLGILYLIGAYTFRLLVSKSSLAFSMRRSVRYCKKFTPICSLNSAER